MPGKRRVGRDLSRLEDAADASQGADPNGFWTALKAYVDPDGDRDDEPDPMDFAPAADTDAEAKQMLGGGRWAFAARYVAVEVDHGPGDGPIDGRGKDGSAGDDRGDTGNV